MKRGVSIINYFVAQDNSNKFFIKSNKKPKLKQILLYCPLSNFKLEKNNEDSDSEYTLKLRGFLFLFLFYGKKAKLDFNVSNKKNSKINFCFKILLGAEKEKFNFLNLLLEVRFLKYPLIRLKKTKHVAFKNHKNFCINTKIRCSYFPAVQYLFKYIYTNFHLNSLKIRISYQMLLVSKY